MAKGEVTQSGVTPEPIASAPDASSAHRNHRVGGVGRRFAGLLLFASTVAAACGIGGNRAPTTPTHIPGAAESASASPFGGVGEPSTALIEGAQPIQIESGQEANMIPSFLRQYFRTDQNQPLWQLLRHPAQDVPYMSRTQSTPIIYERYAFDPQHSNINAAVLPNLQNPGNYDELDYSVWFPDDPVTSNPGISCNVLVDRSSGKVVLTQLQFYVGENGNLMETPYHSSDYWVSHTQASYQDMETTSALWLRTVPSSWQEVANHPPILLGMAERQIEGTVATSSSSTDMVVDSTGGARITTSYTQ